jgi:hypothetical protein
MSCVCCRCPARCNARKGSDADGDLGHPVVVHAVAVALAAGLHTRPVGRPLDPRCRRHSFSAWRTWLVASNAPQRPPAAARDIGRQRDQRMRGPRSSCPGTVVHEDLCNRCCRRHRCRDRPGSSRTFCTAVQEAVAVRVALSVARSRRRCSGARIMAGKLLVVLKDRRRLFLEGVADCVAFVAIGGWSAETLSSSYCPADRRRRVNSSSPSCTSEM